MREITEIIVHCTATMPGQECNAKIIERWHKERGFTSIGYHYVVLPDGTLESGRPLSNVGAHCQGHNARSVGICYVGGLDVNCKPKDTRTPEQKTTLECVIRLLKGVFPKAKVYGHHDFNPGKACPCFDAKTEYANI